MTARGLMLAAALLAACWSAADENPRVLARESYEAFLRMAPPDDPRRASALRRLADLELERAERVQLEGDDLDAARPIYDNAVRIYRDLLAGFPDFEGNDAVHYQLARAYEQRGDIDRAVAELGELITRYPDSKYLIESHFRRGEARFSAGDYDLAAEAYAAILAREDAAESTFYQQALYKLGWSHLRLGEYAPGMDRFLALLNHELAPQGAYQRDRHAALAAGKAALIDDALRATSLSASYLGGVSGLRELLERGHAPGFEFLLYRDLGAHYLQHERFSDAAESYAAFVRDYPNDTHAPHLQLEVIETYRAAGFAERELAAKEAFVERYALTDRDGYWARHAREDSGEIVAALKLHLTELSAHYHALAQDTPDAVDRAERYYRLWLASFPADQNAPETHFLLAELLFAHERFESATQAYEATAYDYGAHPRAAEAGYASLLAYDAHEETLPPTERAAWQRRGIDGALRFSASFTQHAEANNVLVDAAERLFRLGDLPAARAAAMTLIEREPPAHDAHRRTAWTVTGHADFDSGEFAAAEYAYLEVLALSAPDDPARGDLTERLAAAVYKQGEQQRDGGDLAAAVEHFARVAQVAPHAAIRATADYDAAAALIALKDWTRAAGALQAFRATHPGHALGGEVTRNLAAVYLEDGRAADAANELDRIAADAANDAETRRGASQQAAGLYREAGDRARERANLRYYLDTLTRDLDETVDARERLAALALEDGDALARERLLREIVASHDQAAAPTARSRSAAASASLVLADAGWDAFVAMRLVVPLAQSLREKKAAMEALLDAYGAAAGYGDSAVTTAATFRIGELYREMAAALMDSERPPQLNELELEEYEFLLEDEAFPFEEKAIEVHEANARRSAQGVYDDWVRKSFATLARLLPARYAKFEKGERYATLSP